MSKMDDLFSQMQSKKLVSFRKSRLTIQQAVSYALLRSCNVDYLQRDEFDWLDWLKVNKN